MVNFKKKKKTGMITEQNNSTGDSEDDIEIYDSENYRGDKDHIFSHQELVMEVLRKVNESGSHELRSGWFNETMDNSGSIKKVYIEDTRKKFIECVKTAIMIMECDFDTKAHTETDRCIELLDAERTKLLKEQWDWYNSLPPRYKMNYIGKIMEGFFNTEMGWYLKYIETEVECYRAIAKELNYLSKRLDFYRTADFIAT